MKTVIGDLWNQPGWIVVPTNLTTNVHGMAIMGRGVAVQATNKFPLLKKIYGKYLQDEILSGVMFYAGRIICVPVKKHWIDKADVTLIKKSLNILISLLKEDEKVALPLVGCGFGELTQQEVLPILEEMLDNRFTLVLRNRITTRKYLSSFNPGAKTDRSKIFQ